jgi:acyl-CoA synthetase (AMP-forming)/AMP-acid ligase II
LESVFGKLDLSGEPAILFTRRRHPDNTIVDNQLEEYMAGAPHFDEPLQFFRPSNASMSHGDNLPKTRSGKILRRLLRSLAKGEAITQDTSTLENPAILEQLRRSQ